ncbi:unnamed protein product [Periconia digitata]|uniref:Uncharacterized protein n=1 Tax=Periconia digitata TaxID=1303443 RepID=A0A9W4XIB3_9PLEO|nr:unnamed protein product [Periconia digitata]
MIAKGKPQSSSEKEQTRSKNNITAFTAIYSYHRRVCIIVIFILILIVYSHYDTTTTAPMQTKKHQKSSEGSNHLRSIFLPYIYEFESKEVPLVRTTIHGVDIEMPIDTGSTGLLIGAPVLPDIDPTQGTPAYHYLTSSNILYVGRLVPLSVEFHGSEDSRAIAHVPALVVDRSYICPWYDPSNDTFDCPRGENGEEPISRDTSHIMYMGIGFSRNMPGNGQPDAIPARNPFLNIVSIDGVNTSSSTLKTGYIVSSYGVEIGLTEHNVCGFSFASLEPGVTHDEDPRDWAMVRSNFSVDGQTGSFGYGLVDTGVSQMYLRAEEGVSVPTIWIPNPNPNGTAKKVERVRPGTQIDIDFISSKGDKVMGYGFVVGEPSTMHPASVRPAKRTPPPFLNTGRNFLFGYSVAFDAVEGRFGFRPARGLTASTQAATTNSIRSLLA